jgi:hypothetical protein
MAAGIIIESTTQWLWLLHVIFYTDPYQTSGFAMQESYPDRASCMADRYKYGKDVTKVPLLNPDLRLKYLKEKNMIIYQNDCVKVNTGTIKRDSNITLNSACGQNGLVCFGKAKHQQDMDNTPHEIKLHD